MHDTAKPVTNNSLLTLNRLPLTETGCGSKAVITKQNFEYVATVACQQWTGVKIEKRYAQHKEGMQGRRRDTKPSQA
ncbi:hypothetical protein GCM10027098_02850 [Bowmanella dokdonensis]